MCFGCRPGVSTILLLWDEKGGCTAAPNRAVLPRRGWVGLTAEVSSRCIYFSQFTKTTSQLPVWMGPSEQGRSAARDFSPASLLRGKQKKLLTFVLLDRRRHPHRCFSRKSAFEA